MTDEKLVAKLKAYAAAGGTLVLSSRTGMKNKNGHLWETLLQQSIWPLIGASVDFYDHLPPGTHGNVSMDTSMFSWNVWGDNLTPLPGTDVLATYADQFYKGNVAVVKRKTGKGQVYYIGTQSIDGSLEQAVLRKAYLGAGATILNLPDYVFQEWRDGYYVVVNYLSVPYQLKLPAGNRIFSGNPFIQPGGVLVYTLE
jgi:beta-galactosidase